MIILARHAEQAIVFVLLIVLEGLFWTPSTYFAGPNANFFANDPYSTVFYAALLGFLVIVCVLRMGVVLPRILLAWPIIPLVCLAYLSAYWSQFPNAVLVYATKVTAVGLFGIYLVSRGTLDDFVSLFIKVNLVAVVACYAVYFLAPQFVFSRSGPGYADAWRGAFADKNALGINSALGIMFAVYGFIRRCGPRLASGIAIPANILLLIQSQSKTPLLLLLVALYVVLLAMALRNHTGRGLVTAFLLIVLGLAGAAIIASFFADVLAALGRDPTLSLRTRIWQLLGPYVERRPWLGYGFGTFWTPKGQEANEVWGILHWKAPNAHNLWLEMALDLGVIGCFFAAFAWLSAFGRALRLLFVATPVEVVFPMALLTAMLVENLTEYAFFCDNLLWALFAGLLVHLGREQLAARTTSVFRTPWPAIRSPDFSASA